MTDHRPNPAPPSKPSRWIIAAILLALFVGGVIGYMAPHPEQLLPPGASPITFGR